MLVGLSFSWFTARTRSKNNALVTKSGALTLSLDVSKKFSTSGLIPTRDIDIMKAYHNECVDDYGSTACLAYDIVITNDSATQDIVGTIDFTLNHIENLSYLVLDEDDNIYQDITKIDKSASLLPLGSSFVLDGALETGVPTQRKFVLVIWLSDYDYNQVQDIGGSFFASVTYNSIYGQNLTSSVIGSERG